VFESDRQQAGGQHAFDLPRNKKCRILVSGTNFACGSSREHAVPALQLWEEENGGGIDLIIAPSFAEIFRGNAVGNGLVPVTVGPEEYDALVALLAEQPCELEVDILNRTITVLEDGKPSVTLACDLAHEDWLKLTTGTWDDLETCRQSQDKVDAFLASVPSFAVFAP
jgi:3-isopropylmalate/(R)-2-methylmalate dehydratase small subunit